MLVRKRFPWLGIALTTALAPAARAAEPTKGYPEAVVQWGVQKGETCDDIARALYGSNKHVGLLNRYNRVTCKTGTPLPEGLTLVLPEKVTTVPDAKLRSMNPDVRARPAGGAWSAAASGMPLYSNSSVNTLDAGRADVEFVDRTRVFLAPNTLVVIYGTANQTKVSKTPPAAVEVESGEVKAGLSALRGDSVEVAIKGGGRVSAASKDTVVQRKGERTTVEVFQGKAGVASAGKTINVPENFGTRFVGVAPPVPPRPLPPAPAWAPGGTGSIALAPAGKGEISVTWAEIPNAAGYRLEIARDDSFNDLRDRREVGADVRAYRGVGLEPGVYHFHVRAIDKEEYLGIASTDRVIRLVESRIDSGSVTPREIHANPYGLLRFAPSTELEAAIDDGPFGPVPSDLDLQKRAPRAIKLRPRGGAITEEIRITYEKVSAAVGVKPGADGRSVAVDVKLGGVEGIDVGSRVGPRVRVHLPGAAGAAGEVKDAALVPGASANLLSASVPIGRAVASLGPTRVDVVDSRGAVLGTATVDLGEGARPLPAPIVAPEPIPRLGVEAPLWPVSPVTDVFWTSPTAPNSASGGLGLLRGGGAWAFQGQVRASGSLGPMGIDAALRSNASGDGPRTGEAWLGVRARLLRLGKADFELAPLLRLGLPTVSAGAPARLEAGLALGGARGRFGWVADVGGRFRLRDDAGLAGAPTMQGYLLAGATADAMSWLRLHALLDAHVVRRDGGSNDVLGGLGAGLTAGNVVFGAASFRVSPFSAAGEGVFAAQFALGVREAAP